MALDGFGRNSGPSAPPKSPTLFGNNPQPSKPSLPFGSAPVHQLQRPAELGHGYGGLQKTSFNESVSVAYQNANPLGDAWNSRNMSPPKVNFSVSTRMKSFPSYASDAYEASTSFVQDKSERYPSNSASFRVPKRTRSPLPHANEASTSKSPFVEFESERSASLARSSFVPKSPDVASLPEQQASNLRFDGWSGGTGSPPKVLSFQVPKTTRSPPLAYTSESLAPNLHKMQNGTERSPPKPPSFQVPKRTRSPPLAYTDEILTSDNETEREAQAKAKRLARFNLELKQPISNSEHFQKHNTAGNRSDHGGPERKKIVSELSIGGPAYSASGSTLIDCDAMDTAPDGNSESNRAIIGLCPDMCPEAEREERERKGDLDRYERRDGERNQTSKWLAVKKYNRTAEREAQLIRPLPVLQKTVNYLLNLINLPYDDKFLNIYNFLWDRMRAIRMDLRMQHIFNSDAITMYEQMIRLHIIAMHEFCEYSKGEGFSEGFDAHLNIEQMNKTSVELFQMYDDHRKKGIVFPTEKEFRGYYALLKLDKHPGYKVEPAELSLDIAKMTPEMRKAPEVIFARDVARACRSGNFIIFFRHAKKATYLQACLMHAHFGKVRSHGLASLHSGLQNNQGIPVYQIVKWLAMEGEDVESLLEYHGFSIKKYEDAYMVKEGPFLNNDKDFPTKCSHLVHLKKSATIFIDVFSNGTLSSTSKPYTTSLSYKLDHKPGEYSRLPLLNPIDSDTREWENEADGRCNQQELLQVPSGMLLSTNPKSITSPLLSSSKNEGTYQNPLPFWVTSSPSPKNRDIHQTSLPLGGPSPTSPKNRDAHQISSPLEVSSPTGPNNSSYQVCVPPRVSLLTSPNSQKANYLTAFDLTSNENMGSYCQIPTANGMERIFSNSDMDRSPEDENIENRRHEKDQEASISHGDVMEESLKLQKELFEQEELAKQRIEAARAKLRFFLRIWKRRSSRRAELRELQRLMSNAALSSLSLGPPILQKMLPLHPSVELKLDNIVKEREERWRKSWSGVNVSKVVLQILHQKNMHSKCICWKLVLCIRTIETEQHYCNQLAGSWLVSKLMASRNEYEDEDEMVVSTSGLSIWKTWASTQASSQQICCLSILKEVIIDLEGPVNIADALAGAGGVLFLVSENMQWDLDRLRLHNLIMSLPSGSSLPLLILTVGMDNKETNLSSIISDKLELFSLDKAKICGFSVVNISEANGLYSDENLRKGLRWLADQSPVQPVLQQVKSRELVLEYLNASMEELESMKLSEISPHQCINALNNALEKSASDIISAAQMNPTYWPGPEIGLIDEFTKEARAVSFELPKVGWSSSAAIEHVLSSLTSCKLPEFTKDFSWQKKAEIHTQKLALESTLRWYLTEACRMMQGDFAAREVCLMVQRGATLDFDGTSCQILPQWVTIFHRIFNWRLMNLTSNAYVLKHRHRPSPDEHRWSRHRLLAGPSLDEMIEVSWGIPRRQFQPLECNRGGGEMREGGQVQSDEACISHGSDANGEKCLEMQLKRELAGECRDGKLNSLLERCTMLQNMIDEKLYIYF